MCILLKFLHKFEQRPCPVMVSMLALHLIIRGLGFDSHLGQILLENKSIIKKRHKKRHEYLKFQNNTINRTKWNTPFHFFIRLLYGKYSLYICFTPCSDCGTLRGLLNLTFQTEKSTKKKLFVICNYIRHVDISKYVCLEDTSFFLFVQNQKSVDFKIN